MEYYASEQEQVEQIKRWWKDNGKPLLFGLFIGLGGLAGYRYWDGSMNAQAESASLNYARFLEMIDKQSLSDARTTGEMIVANYGGTSYARLSTLLLAKMAVERGDYEDAKSRLQSLIDSDASADLKLTAQGRLARILLAENDVAGAAEILADMTRNGAATERFAELRGDVFSAQGDTEQARSAYITALAQETAQGLDGSAVQLKLDNLAEVAK